MMNSMNFDLNDTIALLERTPKVFREWTGNLPESWENANEGPETWGAKDILGHFIVGEKTDWIPRARKILGEDPDPHFVPFDRFAQNAFLSNTSISELLDDFSQLRAQNLNTLRAWELSPPDLKKEGIHPDFGTVTLQQLIAMWAVHDQAHIYQLARVFVKHYAKDIGPWAKYVRVLNDHS